MRRGLIWTGILALTLAACGGTTTGSGGITLAQGEQQAMTNTISVSGQGEVSGAPDTLVVELGVSVLRPTVDEATGEAARLATAVIDALKANGVADEDIQTINYSIWPEYDYRNDSAQLRGYRVSNTVSAKIRTISSAGEVIDAATTAGGDDMVVSGIRFDIEENGELVKAARDAAWNDAKAKAEQLADLAGIPLGPVVSITESSTSAPPPIVYERAAAQAGDVSTPIEPGAQTVTVTVSVSFSIGT